MRNQLTRYAAIAALSVLLSASASATTVTSRPVIDLASGANVEDGISTIIRDPDGVTITVHTNLPPGAYTVWLLIWNNPENCTGGAPDLLCLPRPDPPESVKFATGNVVPDTGRADFTVHVPVGETEGIIAGGVRAGLTNPMKAEIHVVMRTHGAPIPELLTEQITTPGGGCDVNTCADLQAAGHPPGLPDAHDMALQEVKRLSEQIARRLGMVVNPE